MPLYVFRCSREHCGREVEVLQKWTDPAPKDGDEDLPIEGRGPCSASPTQEPCLYERAPTSWGDVIWRGDYGNEGRDGWVRQGDVMIRASKGKSGEQRQ